MKMLNRLIRFLTRPILAIKPQKGYFDIKIQGFLDFYRNKIPGFFPDQITTFSRGKLERRGIFVDHRERSEPRSTEF